MSESAARPAGPVEKDGQTFTVVLDREQDYRFSADVGIPGVPPLVIDEPEPLGAGAGPNASRLLAAAVGHCLSASALFCLARAHIPVSGARTTVTGTLVRNDAGRLRVGALSVHIELEVAEQDRARMGRCLDLFEDFCVVTASVRGGIEVDVTVSPTS